jgi:cAMP-binding proteins - catabolite gene activator and regulatory subunit of cAMP-dependent protein kinases
MIEAPLLASHTPHRGEEFSLVLSWHRANTGCGLVRRTLERAHDHIILNSKTAKCRTATFFTELWVRLGQPKYLDVPMSHQDIADYLGLTIETLSRSITDLERSGLISRVSGRKLLLQNRFALGRMMN